MSKRTKPSKLDHLLRATPRRQISSLIPFMGRNYCLYKPKAMLIIIRKMRFYIRNIDIRYRNLYQALDVASYPYKSIKIVFIN